MGSTFGRLFRITTWGESHGPAIGVIIGIAAVIAFVTLGASLQAGVIGDISPNDQRNIYGWAADPDTEGGPLAGTQPVTPA